jgi:hypothetical protein
MTDTGRNLASAGRAAFIGFCVVAALFLIYEHTMHVLGVLPYLLLLACPLMHVFMHHVHQHGGRHQNGVASPDAGPTGRNVNTRGDGI